VGSPLGRATEGRAARRDRVGAGRGVRGRAGGILMHIYLWSALAIRVLGLGFDVGG
jgi:hypothetical protein